MNLRFFFGLVLCALVFVSCEKNNSNEVLPVADILEDPAEASIAKISDETTDFLQSQDLNLEGAELTTMQYPDGTTEEVYIIEGDITLTKEEFEDIQNSLLNNTAQLRQYRTYNLVNSPRTVSVIGYTGNNSSGLSTRMRTSLQWAINNYNALNTGLNFTLTYGTNYSPYDIVVYRVANGQQGGRAGFPYSNGDPYKWCRIYSGLDNSAYNTIEHVITHEIGHCLGLRHTDWNTRASCNQSGEAANPDGAVHIPGTPTGFDSNSVMLACFGSNEDGEFGFYDRVALEYLY